MDDEETEKCSICLEVMVSFNYGKENNYKDIFVFFYLGSSG